ncbi:unnamed protein product [Prunus armeniaca]
MGIKRTSTLSSTTLTSHPLPTTVWMAEKSKKLADFYPKSPSLVRAIPSTICFDPEGHRIESTQNLLTSGRQSFSKEGDPYRFSSSLRLCSSEFLSRLFSSRKAYNSSSVVDAEEAAVVSRLGFLGMNLGSGVGLGIGVGEVVAAWGGWVFVLKI